MFRIILCLSFYCIVIFTEVLIIVCVLYVLCYCTNPDFGCYILINFFYHKELPMFLYVHRNILCERKFAGIFVSCVCALSLT